MDAWLKENLVCPRDHMPLGFKGAVLACPQNHKYPLIDDIPIMLVEEVRPAQSECSKTLKQSTHPRPEQPVHREAPAWGAVDPFVQKAVGATCGALYASLRGKLAAYPIPELRLPSVSGKRFLELGCNWGRWCISATRRGYAPVGIDHNLNAIRAAYRIAKQLKVPAVYLVADMRRLPFATGCFDTVFSYSVLQHFSKSDVREAVSEAGRVLRPSRKTLIQMPNLYGLRNVLVRFRRGFREPAGFEVRYWHPKELERLFQQLIGPTRLLADGYFSLNAQISDLPLLPLKSRFIVYCSNLLRKLTSIAPPLKYLADSLYVEAIRRPPPGASNKRGLGGERCT